MKELASFLAVYGLISIAGDVKAVFAYAIAWFENRKEKSNEEGD